LRTEKLGPIRIFYFRNETETRNSEGIGRLTPICSFYQQLYFQTTVLLFRIRNLEKHSNFHQASFH